MIYLFSFLCFLSFKFSDEMSFDQLFAAADKLQELENRSVKLAGLKGHKVRKIQTRKIIKRRILRYKFPTIRSK